MAAHRPGAPGPAPAGRRGQVLAVLRDADGPVPIADIAGRLGVHVNTVRFHLDALVGSGQVERVTGTSRAPGRPPQLFRAVARMDPAGPRHYQVLAEVLADALAAEPDPSERAVTAGRAWGRRLGTRAGDGERTRAKPVDRLIGLLEELGFAPELMPGPARSRAPEIGLRSCPFLEVAASRPAVACPVHLGMMQGAMGAWGAAVDVDALQPFVEPDLCVARLSVRSA